MNISLTPIEDAWNKPKKREKQRKETQQIPLPITMNEADKSDKSDKMEIVVSQDFYIKNENILELLKPYKNEYINNLVETLLYNHFNKNEFDIFNFVNHEDSGIYILFSFLMVMVIIDMIIRHRYK